MPQEGVSYLTAEGSERLRQELEYLKGPGRIDIAKRLRIAIQQGDLSENADYIATKEEQAFLEGRVLELEQILQNTVIIEEIKKDTSLVNVGARITIQEDNFDPETYFLVGPKEADPVKGQISYESPIGQALMGHKVGDLVNAQTPTGVIKLKIIKIE
jgi:transcription elongation factor GreA